MANPLYRNDAIFYYRMSKGKQFLIFIIIINFVLLGAYGLFFYSIKTASEEASALSYDLEEKRTNKDELSLLQHSLNETKEDREKLNSYFVRSGNIDSFIERIISLGDESGITIMLNGLTETPDNTLTIDLRGSGKFEDLFYFMKLIEHIPYHIEFKKVYLNTTAISTGDPGKDAKEEASTRKWDASFTLTLFGFIKE